MCDDVGDGDNGKNNAGNDADKGDGGDAGREGEGGLLAEDAVAVAAAAGTVAVAAAAYCRGCRECNIPVQKMSVKEWKRSHKSKRVLTVLHFIIMVAVKNCNSIQLLTKTGTIVKGRMRLVMKSV